MTCKPIEKNNLEKLRPIFHSSATNMTESQSITNELQIQKRVLMLGLYSGCKIATGQIHEAIGFTIVFLLCVHCPRIIGVNALITIYGMLFVMAFNASFTPAFVLATIVTLLILVIETEREELANLMRPTECDHAGRVDPRTETTETVFLDIPANETTRKRKLVRQDASSEYDPDFPPPSAPVLKKGQVSVSSMV
jgi:hypothetical protein